MKKQSKQLIILLLVLVLLVACAFGLRKYNEMQAQSEVQEEETGITVIDVAKEDIVKLSYTYEGLLYTYEKEGDTWYYTGDHSINLNQDAVSEMLAGVAPLVADREITDVTDYSQYGLETALAQIFYETADASYIIEIGEYNSIAGIYYMKLAEGTKVYTVPSKLIDNFCKTLEDLSVE